ncbi:glycosyltransferase [Agreia sp. VKM Ac-1783]|uniref:glycosyltransferase n=1 Tax=Agreia sp. VKM Ac-1783 TaxID=1938889 RepID=UPI000A2ADB56|nr:glycosyltransferase [Agreia sp. VKM Ac-1783]SMQ58493.1 Glycosyltransferase involved in cell wall bisynthesis [Agreia sp. VKM Ac-1783]
MSRGGPQLRVLHLDHTQARGGAEYALLRVLKKASWAATLGLPAAESGSFNVYGALSGLPNVTVETIGPRQRFGASSSRSILGIARFAAAALGQAVSIRRSRAFARADLIHTNTSRAAVYAAIASVGSGTPLVVHLRDLVDKPSLGSVGYALFTRIALARAAGVIANSQSTLASATPFLSNKTKHVIIPSAAGIESTGRSSPSKDVLTRVGMVARLDPWKGQDLLIRAFAGVFRGGEVQLLLAGDAAFGHEGFLVELEGLARELGIEDQVQFLGHIDDVPEFIDSLDVCVQASTRPEPLGQNILQYLSAGKAIIATSVGGPSEWIRHEKSGLLFEMGDEESLMTNLRRVSHVSIRRTLEDGARRAPGLLSDAEVADLHQAFFKEVARP